MPSYNLGTAEGRIVIDGSGAKQGFNVAEAAANGFVSAVNAKIGQIEQFGQRLVAVGTAGVAGFGVAVAAASSFEERISAISAVSGLFGEDLDAIREKALQLGADTSFGATDAAQAIEELVKAGLTADEVLGGAADAAVALAAAGEIDLAQAAEIAASAMNNFNLEASELPAVADSIAGAANASAISVGEFNQSLQQVGAVANLTGLSFNDTAVAIAELGNAGIKGSDAGTSLKTMFMNLIPTTKDQIKEFERLGLLTNDTTAALEAMARDGIEPVGESYEQIRQAVSAHIAATQGITDNTVEMGEAVDDYLRINGGMQNAFFDSEGNMKSLADVQGVLQQATADMTNEQKLASLELLFGSDAIRAAAVMADNGAEGFNELAAAMGNVTAQEVAETRMDNLAGSVEKLKGSFETALITIGDVVLPILRRFVDALTWLVDLFNNLPGPVKQAIGVLFAVATVFSLIMGGLTLLLIALPALLGKFLLFRTIGAVTKGLGAFFTTLRAGAGIGAALSAGIAPLKTLGSTVMRVGRIAFAAGKLMRAAWIMATGPIGLIVIAIAALVAGFIWAYNNVEWFRDGVNAAIGAVRDFFVAAWDKIKSAVSAVIDWFKTDFISFFQELPGKISDWFSDAVDSISNFFSELPGKVWGWLTDLGSSIADTASGLWGGLLDGLETAWDAVMEFLMELPNNVARGLGLLAGYLVRGAINLWRGLVDGLSAAVEGIIWWWTELPGIIWGYIVGLGNTIKDGASAAWDWVKTTAIDAWNATMAWLEALPGRIEEWFTNLSLSIGRWANDSWASVTSGVSAAWDGAMAWLEAFPTRVEEWFTNLSLSIGRWANSTWASVTTGLSEAWTSVQTWFTELPGKIQSSVSEAGTWLMEAGGNILQGLKDGLVGGWEAFWGWVTGLWDSFVQGFKDAMGIASPSTVFMQFGQWIIQGLWNGLQSVIQTIFSFFSNAVTNIKNGFSTAGSWLVNAGQNVINGLRHGAQSIWNGFWGWISGLGSTIINLFSGAGSWLLNAGQNVVRGMWNGISGMVSWLTSKIRNWAGNIVDNVLGALGIRSPSVHMIYAGEMLTKGLAKGVDDNADDAVRATTRMAEAIQDGWDAAMPDLTAMIEAQAGIDVATTSAMSASMAGAMTGILPATNDNPSVPASAEVQDAANRANIKYEFNTYNPVAEKASDSEARALRATSAMGGLG